MLACVPPVVTVMAGARMRVSNRSKFSLRAALTVSLTLATSLSTAGHTQAQSKQKSNVQRERCAQVAARAVNTPGNLYYSAPVSGYGGGGGGIAGAIIGAVIITAIAASVANAARVKAENSCLVAAGLKPNSEPSAAPDKPTRSGTPESRASKAREAATDAVGTGAFRGGGVHAWVAESLKSQK